MTDKIKKVESVEAPVDVKAPVEVKPETTKTDYVSKEDFESAISKIGDLIAANKPVAVVKPVEDVKALVQVPQEITQSDVLSSSDAVREALQHNGIHTIYVDVEDYINANMSYNENTKVTEAFTAGGTAASGQFPAPNGSDIASNSSVSIRPSGESFIPVRQWIDVKVLPKGTTEAIWYHMDSSFSGDGSLNAVITSDITEQNKAITNTVLKVTSQIGFRTILNATDLEDSKFDLAGAFRDIAARRKLQSELKSLTDLLQSTTNLHGGIANGATIGTTTLDTQIQVNRTQSSAGIKEITVADVLNIVAYYKENGYDGWNQTSGVAPVLVCSINTWKTLLQEAITSQSYGQFFVGSNLVTAKPTFEQLFGIVIVPCNQIVKATGSAVQLTSSAYSFLPKYTVAMATKRELEIKFQEDTTKLRTNVTASWRDAFTIIDPKSIVRYDIVCVSGALAAKTS